MQEQLMVLVNEADEAIGLMPKMQAHQEGVLHRAFSVFLFTQQGEMILQQRASSKYHSPNLWTNACCSHPYENEDVQVAANRRMKEELGIEVDLTKAFTFIYKANMENGLIEHELDHVFVGTFEGEFDNLNANEVSKIKTISFANLDVELVQQNNLYTEWFKIAYPTLKNWLTLQTANQ
jgi:isopentenyl-diphosphate Delta-isomerase